MVKHTALLATLLAAGCSAEHRFRLEDVEALTLGVSGRDDVLRSLGPPDETGAHVSVETRIFPPTPLAFLTWPVYWSRSDVVYTVTAGFDVQGVLREASLRVDGGSRSFLLILIQPHLLAPRVGKEELRLLRALEAKGVKVAVGAYAVDEYERRFP